MAPRPQGGQHLKQCESPALAAARASQRFVCPPEPQATAFSTYMAEQRQAESQLQVKAYMQRVDILQQQLTTFKHQVASVAGLDALLINLLAQDAKQQRQRCSAQKGSLAALEQQVAGLQDSLAMQQADHAGVAQQLQQAVHAAESSVRGLGTAVAALHQQQLRRQAELQAARQQASELDAQCKHALADAQQQRHLANATAVRTSELEQQLSDQQQVMAASSHQHAASLQQLQVELHQQRQQTVDAEQRCAQMQQQLGGLLRDMGVTVALLTTALQQQRERGDAAEAVTGQVRSECEALKRQAASERAAHQAQVAQLLDCSEQERARATCLQATLASSQQQLAAMAVVVQQQVKQVEAADSAAEKAEGMLAELANVTEQMRQALLDSTAKQEASERKQAADQAALEELRIAGGDLFVQAASLATELLLVREQCRRQAEGRAAAIDAAMAPLQQANTALQGQLVTAGLVVWFVGWRARTSAREQQRRLDQYVVQVQVLTQQLTAATSISVSHQAAAAQLQQRVTALEAEAISSSAAHQAATAQLQQRVDRLQAAAAARCSPCTPPPRDSLLRWSSGSDGSSGKGAARRTGGQQRGQHVAFGRSSHSSSPPAGRYSSKPRQSMEELAALLK